MENLSKQINIYFSGCVVPIGIIFNLISLIVFIRHRMNTKTNMGIYYSSLAIYDSLALTNSILFIQFLPSLGINLPSLSVFGCHFLSIYRRSVIQSPSWMQVIITFDRFRSVCFPTKFIFMEQKRFIIKIVIGLFFIMFLLNMEHGWFFLSRNVVNQTVFDIVTNKTFNRTNLYQTCTASQILLSFTDLKMVFMRSYIPVFIMLFLNIIVSRTFLSSRKKMNKKESLIKEYTFTRTVILMNVTFFILYLPWSVWYAVNTVFKNTPGAMTKTISAKLSLTQSIFFSIAYLNNCSSFFVNFVFNRHFRNELFNCLKLKNENKVTSNSSSTSAAFGSKK